MDIKYEKVNHIDYSNKNLIEKIEKLQKENELLKKCVEFYADKKTYNRSATSNVAREVVAQDCDNQPNYAQYCAGKKARECLVKLEQK